MKIRYCFLFVVLSVLVFSSVMGQAADPVWIVNAAEETIQKEPIPISGSDLLREKEREVRAFVKSHPEALERARMNKSTAWNFQVGDTKTWWSWNFSTSQFYQVSSTCRAVGEHCYIFVEDSEWETGGSGRVTQASVDSSESAFDDRTLADPTQGIYELDVATFGDPPDYDSDPKIIILLQDIRDDYNPSTNPVYVAGYFWSINEISEGDAQSIGGHSNEAEIFFLDVNPADMLTPSGVIDAMGTIAHEFQHMIHWNMDDDEDTFVNEGCSTVAEVVCGYPIYNQSLFNNETNIDLFTWRSGSIVLNDYSRSARWTLYLHEQFPNGYLKLLVAASADKVGGINQSLLSYTPATSRTFLDIFEDWCVANYVMDTTVDPKYGYAYTPLNPVASTRTHVNPNVTAQAGSVSKYGAEYITYTGGSNLSITFTSTAPQLVVKAVKIGSTVVEDVPLNTLYTVPDYGTTYSEVTFVLINKHSLSNASYTYTSTGTSTSATYELSYDDGEPEGYLNLSQGDTVSVYFDGMSGAVLDSIKIAFRRAGTIRTGINRFTGTLRPTPIGQELVSEFDITCTTETASVPYPVPYDNWITVDLSSQQIDAGPDFIVWMRIENYTAPGVMVSDEPDVGTRHSMTYLVSNGDWYYLTSAGGIWKYLIRAFVSTTSGVKETFELTPKDFALEQNYPNPFNPGTTIYYSLPATAQTTLTVFDALGREMATLVNERKEAGEHSVEFDASYFSSGVYFYRLQAGDETQIRKMILIK